MLDQVRDRIVDAEVKKLEIRQTCVREGSWGFSDCNDGGTQRFCPATTSPSSDSRSAGAAATTRGSSAAFRSST
jgi:hypothetical protein